MIDDEIIEAIVKVGNDPSVIKMCEPQICYSFKLESWMVKRTLEGQELLNKWVRDIGE